MTATVIGYVAVVKLSRKAGRDELEYSLQLHGEPRKSPLPASRVSFYSHGEPPEYSSPQYDQANHGDSEFVSLDPGTVTYDDDNVSSTSLEEPHEIPSEPYLRARSISFCMGRLSRRLVCQP